MCSTLVRVSDTFYERLFGVSDTHYKRLIIKTRDVILVIYFSSKNYYATKTTENKTQ